MLPISYYLLSLIMLFLIFQGYRKALKKYYKDKTIVKRRVFILTIGITIWFIYLFLLSESSFLFDFTLPPRFLILILLPFFIFCMLFYNRNKYSAFIQTIPLEWTVYYQTFRILVEIILVSTFIHGIVPIEATIEGYNFDIIMGVSAPFVGFYLLKNIKGNKNKLIFWNLLGISMILFVAFIIGTSAYTPTLWGYSEPALSFQFLTFPYLLLAGFLAPSAIFMHLVTLIQLKKYNN